jgi:hypothetical protein
MQATAVNCKWGTSSGWGAWGGVAVRTLGPGAAWISGSGTGTGWFLRGAALATAAAGAQVRFRVEG